MMSEKIKINLKKIADQSQLFLFYYVVFIIGINRKDVIMRTMIFENDLEYQDIINQYDSSGRFKRIDIHFNYVSEGYENKRQKKERYIPHDDGYVIVFIPTIRLDPVGEIKINLNDTTELFNVYEYEGELWTKVPVDFDTHRIKDDIWQHKAYNDYAISKSEYNVFWKNVKPFPTDERHWFACSESITLNWPSTHSSEVNKYKEFISSLWNHYSQYMIINDEFVTLWEKPLFQGVCAYGIRGDSVVLEISRVHRSQYHVNPYNIMSLDNIYDRSKELHDDLLRHLEEINYENSKVTIVFDSALDSISCNVFKPEAFSIDINDYIKEREQKYAEKYWELYNETTGNCNDETILKAINKMVDQKRAFKKDYFLGQDTRYYMALRYFHFAYGAEGDRREKFFNEALEYLIGTHEAVQKELRTQWLKDKY